MPSTFILEYLEKEIRPYHDKTLLDDLTFGFPLGINKRKTITKNAEDNHSSTNTWPNSVEEFIRDEISHGALLGPFDNLPHPFLQLGAFRHVPIDPSDAIHL